jgi:hypothetical protein
MVCKGKGGFRRSEEAVFRRISRVTAWLLLFLIAVFSVISPYYRVVTIVPHTVEHLASFLFVDLAIGLGYPFGHRARSGPPRAHWRLSCQFAGAERRDRRGLPGGHTSKGQLPPFDDAAVDKDQSRLQARFVGMNRRLAQ